MARLRFPYKLEEARVIILGIPFEAEHYGKLKGASRATRAIRKYFDHYYSYDLERGIDLYDLPIYDAGDVKVSKDIARATRLVTRAIARLLKRNQEARFCFLGGDHLITSFTTRALRIKSLLAFDSHLDLLSLEEARGYEHASSLRLALESVTKLYVRGVRDVAKSELTYAKIHGVDWRRDLKRLPRKVDYLSLDLDVLNPFEASVASPVAMGFGTREVIEAIRKVSFRHADLVEWIPTHGYASVVAIFRELLISLATAK